MCTVAGYADDLGLGERLIEHVSEDDFNVVDNTHPITAGAGVAGVPLGSIDIGSPVWVDTLSTRNHYVDVLVNSVANRAVLVAHKTHPFVYFGWYRMSQASSGSPLFDLLLQSANWAFSGP